MALNMVKCWRCPLGSAVSWRTYRCQLWAASHALAKIEHSLLLPPRSVGRAGCRSHSNSCAHLSFFLLAFRNRNRNRNRMQRLFGVAGHFAVKGLLLGGEY